MVVFAFRNSTSHNSEDGIHSVFDAISATLSALTEDVEALKPAWVATEADRYYALVANFHQGAEQIANILTTIENALETARLTTGEFRNQVDHVLRS